MFGLLPIATKLSSKRYFPASIAFMHLMLIFTNIRQHEYFTPGIDPSVENPTARFYLGTHLSVLVLDKIGVTESPSA